MPAAKEDKKKLGSLFGQNLNKAVNYIMEVRFNG